MDPALGDDPRFLSLADRKANEAALESLISNWSCRYDRWQITRQLQAVNIAAFPSLSTADIIADPHLNDRGFVERLEHPEVGARPHTGIAWKLRHRPCRVTRPAPCLGEDSARLLQEVLGYEPEQIAELQRDKVLT